jgi:hypothetical protein
MAARFHPVDKDASPAVFPALRVTPCIFIT